MSNVTIFTILMAILSGCGGLKRPLNNNKTTTIIQEHPKFNDECVDPDLTKMDVSVSLTLCDGSLASGLYSTPIECVDEGEIGCLTTNDLRPVTVAKITADSLKVGSEILGVSGSVIPRPKDCSSDGESACVVDGNEYKAAKLANVASSDLKQGVTIAGVQGTLANCQTDGESECVATSLFKAADMSKASEENILEGVRIAGVVGSVKKEHHIDCTQDGEENCVTTSALKAANLQNLSAGNIKNGVTLAGVEGKYPSLEYPLIGSTATDDLPDFSSVLASTEYEWFTADGTRKSGTIEDNQTVIPSTTDTVLNSGLYRSILVKGSQDLISENIRENILIFGVTGSLKERPIDCSDNAEVGCVTTESYKAADLLNLTAENIRHGKTIAGISGTYPSVLNPLDGASSEVADLVSLSSASSAGTYEFFDAYGARYEGTIQDKSLGKPITEAQVINAESGLFRSVVMPGDANLIAGNIKEGVVIFDVNGNVKQESHMDCSSDGATGCATTSDFPAVEKSRLLSGGNIKNGVTLAGVEGKYPSSEYPLAGHNVATDDLTFATMHLKLKNAATFQWFTSTGARHESPGDTDIQAANIKSGITIFGEAGTVIIPSDCSSDGQQSCVVKSPYKAANMTGIDEWQIRKGKTVGGVTGKLAYFKNTISNSPTSTKNYTISPANAALNDVWDTLDDNGLSSPSIGLAPSEPSSFVSSGYGWPIANVGNWLNSSNYYIDSLTGIIWSDAHWQSNIASIGAAIQHCHNLTDGPWRLPTQKEMMQAYINGITQNKIPLGLTVSYNFWTSTQTGYANEAWWIVNLATGATVLNTTTTGNNAICVK